MMLCPTDTNEKSESKLSDFWLGWPDSDRRMRESKSRALPLGYTPIYYNIIPQNRHFVKSFFPDCIYSFENFEIISIDTCEPEFMYYSDKT